MLSTILKSFQSHNTSVFRLLLPDGFRLGLPVGQHISLQAEINGKTVTRSYTPITLDSVVGYVDVLIKGTMKKSDLKIPI